MKSVTLIIVLAYSITVFCAAKPEQVSLFSDDSAKHPSQCINSWVWFPITPEVLQGYEMSVNFVKARKGTEQPVVDVKNSICIAYIYVDTEAGITLYLDSLWKLTREGLTKINAGVGEIFTWKRRIDKAMNYLKVWTLGEEQQKTFHLEPTPKWMDSFLPEKKDVVYLTKVGFFLNAIGDCESATKYLEQAYAMGPVSDKLVFELSFAYNFMKRTDKSIKVLQKALEENPANIMAYRELGYAYLISRQFEQAIKAYMEGIKQCGETNMETKSEMAINASQAYYHSGNQEAADEWYNKAANWAPPGSPIIPGTQC